MTQARNRIFISYRRDDARGASGRLYDWLRIAFGREQVFRDVASIGPGKWQQKIDEALTASAVCLPMIGLRWCDATNGARLADENDMVRHELVTALAHSDRGLTIILTLVEGAKVPSKSALPKELHDLLEWNAYPLSEEGWEDDVRRLVGAVADCTGQMPAADVDTLITRVGEAETRMRAMEQEKHLQTDQIRALTDTVAALTRHLAERPAAQRADLVTALEALGRGDTSAAEAEFERVLEERSAAAADAAHEAAEAARHIGNLALISDISKAIRYYRRACELEPGQSTAWRLLGQACLISGNTIDAKLPLTRALEEAERSNDSWDRMAALTLLGDLAMRTMHLDEALKQYDEARKIVTNEATRYSGKTEWLRGLSISQDRIGDMLMAQGDLLTAFRAYLESFSIREMLVAHDQSNPQLHRELAVSHDLFGNVMWAKGDLPNALMAYRKGLGLREALVVRDRTNTEWQHDLSVSHEKIGNVLLGQGDLAGALSAYRQSHRIRETLVAWDRANIEWQRHLWVSHSQIGDVLRAQGNLDGALSAYCESLAFFETCDGGSRS